VIVSKLPDFLGSYRLSRFIRSGSSSQIYEAIKDDESGRYILKILRPQHWGNRQEMALLKHEYEVAHQIEHPSVIRVYEYHAEGKIAYLALELFSDLNMKQMMREQGLSFIHVNFASIVEQSATALHALHSEGWVHCDVKPDNFLLNEEAKVKLIDFTISQKVARGKLSSMFRSKGQVQGTRSYMSPEQIRNESLDARADIYSLGCVLFELLGGKVPYTGTSPNDLLNKHLKAPNPSVQVNNENVSDPMNNLITRMMGKTPEERPANMADVVKEMKTFRLFKRAPRLDSEPNAEASDE
jgi:serine/threonine protein kinase